MSAPLTGRSPVSSVEGEGISAYEKQLHLGRTFWRSLTLAIVCKCEPEKHKVD
ncbi:mCG140937 [Mus musculus]|nr:mCG140937 [Mus musculus]